MAQRPGRATLGYLCVLAGSFTVAMIAGWTPLASRIDGSAYDWMFQLQPPPPWTPTSVILAIDEATLAQTGGSRHLRPALAKALDRIRTVQPKSVAIDVILADEADPAEDAALEAALRQTHNLILPSDLIPKSNLWEEPLPRFRQFATAVGHVHADPDPICRSLILYKVAGHDRRWALSVEAFRLASGARQIVESPNSLQIGSTTIPVRRSDPALQIRYLKASAGGVSRIPEISLKLLNEDPAVLESFRNKTVFVGETALSQARDRLMTPYEQMMSGVEIHAQAFETMAHGKFFQPASNLSVIGFCLLITLGAGVAFFYFSGWPAYLLGAALVATAHAVPHLAFASRHRLPLSRTGSRRLAFRVRCGHVDALRRSPPVAQIGIRQGPLSAGDALRHPRDAHASHRHPGLERADGPLHPERGKAQADGPDDQLRIEAPGAHDPDLSRRRAPLRRPNGAQGASPSNCRPVIDACLQRAQPLAERKQIQHAPRATRSTFPLTGDRELMEYAFYNLLTNAVKYSPAETKLSVFGAHAGRATCCVSR